MPPKLDRCVRAVKPRTGTSRAYAICTASLQRAGVIPRKSKTMAIRSYRVTNNRSGEVLGVFRAQSAGGARRAAARAEGYSAAEVRAMTGNHPRLAHFDVAVVSKKVANPASACSPVRRGKAPFNSHEGQYVVYNRTRYRIMGCGTGATARRSIGKQEEGTYALLNEKTNKVRYVAKRVVRDILYRRGREGAPAPRGPRTAAKRKGAAKRAAKMSAAKKRAFVERMARARAAKGR